MRYRVRIYDDLKYIVGDRPRITGIVTADGAAPDLIGVTFSLQSYENTTVLETLGSIDSTGEAQISLGPLTRTETGRVLVKAYERKGSAVLSAGISAADTSVDINTTTGTIPESGFCTVGNEMMTYTLSGSTLTLVRGYLSTASAHSLGDVIKFGNTAETCTPYEQYCVIRREEVFIDY